METVYGTPEPECAIYGHEVNLHKNVICEKNPGHKQFIPVQNLSVDHFPVLHRNEWRVRRVKAMADLTVHLKVRIVSKDRPQFFSGSHQPFPFHGCDDVYRTGSGFVGHAFKHSQGDERFQGELCDCNECVASLNPKSTWWEVRICSALHVVFDDVEVKDTEVKFFFDHAHSKTVVLKGHSMRDSDLEGDWCVFKLISHNEEFGRRLENAKQRFRSDFSGLMRHLTEPIIIISHPHGCPKHVTIGQKVENLSNGGSCITYTTCTCPGSSGGWVMGGSGWSDQFRLQGFPHSQALANGVNRSGEGWWVFKIDRTIQFREKTAQLEEKFLETMKDRYRPS